MTGTPQTMETLAAQRDRAEAEAQAAAAQIAQHQAGLEARAAQAQVAQAQARERLAAQRAQLDLRPSTAPLPQRWPEKARVA